MSSSFTKPTMCVRVRAYVCVCSLHVSLKQARKQVLREHMKTGHASPLLCFGAIHGLCAQSRHPAWGQRPIREHRVGFSRGDVSACETLVTNQLVCVHLDFVFASLALPPFLSGPPEQTLYCIPDISATDADLCSQQRQTDPDFCFSAYDLSVVAQMLVFLHHRN